MLPTTVKTSRDYIPLSESRRSRHLSFSRLSAHLISDSHGKIEFGPEIEWVPPPRSAADGEAEGTDNSVLPRTTHHQQRCRGYTRYRVTPSWSGAGWVVGQIYWDQAEAREGFHDQTNQWGPRVEMPIATRTDGQLTSHGKPRIDVELNMLPQDPE